MTMNNRDQNQNDTAPQDASHSDKDVEGDVLYPSKLDPRTVKGQAFDPNDIPKTAYDIKFTPLNNELIQKLKALQRYEPTIYYDLFTLEEDDQGRYVLFEDIEDILKEFE